MSICEQIHYMWQEQYHRNHHNDDCATEADLPLIDILNEGWEFFFKNLLLGAETEGCYIRYVRAPQALFDKMGVAGPEASYKGVKIILDNRSDKVVSVRFRALAPGEHFVRQAEEVGE